VISAQSLAVQGSASASVERDMGPRRGRIAGASSSVTKPDLAMSAKRFVSLLPEFLIRCGNNVYDGTPHSF
jgi:hypothetical protein